MKEHCKILLDDDMVRIVLGGTTMELDLEFDGFDRVLSDYMNMVRDGIQAHKKIKTPKGEG